SRGTSVVLQNLSRAFGATRALDGLSIEMAPGELVALLGPSGCGKTTALRIVAGFETRDSGSVLVDGKDISSVPAARRDMGMVFQSYSLFPNMSALDNVGFGLRMRKVGTAERRTKAAELLEMVGLAPQARQFPHQLSGGQQQRVALARAIVARPGLLLFDEPLSNLDTDLRERLRVEISTLTRESGATAVYITHDQAEAFALADVIGVLDQGRLAQLADPETIYLRPATPFVARFTGLSGELTGTVAQLGADGLARIHVGERRLRGRAIGKLSEGDSARLLVRPTATAIAGLDEATDNGDAVDGVLDGTVIDVAYRGRGYDHVVACADSTLTSVFAPRAFARGTRVRITLDPDGCIAYPADDTV
ncbi:MAG: ABC transporter ATP-binding protein, partial [Actinocrinis sp.]